MKTRLSLLIFVSVLLLLLSVFPAAAATEAPGVINNGSFEAPLPGSGWSVTNAVGDKQVCNLPDPIPADGQCMFRFKGGAGKTTLTHIVNPSGLQIVENQATCDNLAVGTQMQIYRKGAAAFSAKVVLKMKLNRQNSTFTLKFVDRIDEVKPNTWEYWSGGFLAVPAGSEVKKIVFSVTHNAPKGKLFVDDVKFLTVPLGNVC